MIHDLPKSLVDAARQRLEESNEYEVFFAKALKKFGVDSPADFKDEKKKKEFFDYVDANYKGKSEDLEVKKKVNESKDVRKKYRGKEQKAVDNLIMQKGVDKVQQFHDKNPKEFDKMVKNIAMMEEVEEELLDENIQKVVKLYPRDNDWKKLVSKYKRDIENFMKGRKDLPPKVEDELLSWGFDAGEIRNEKDAENFIDDILNA